MSTALPAYCPVIAAAVNVMVVVAAVPVAPVVAAPPPPTAVTVLGVPSVLNSMRKPVALPAVPVSAMF